MQKTADYFKSLPRKLIAAEALFVNKKNEVLLVKPTYRDHWQMPGGIVEINESPFVAALREIKEELNLTVSNLQLLVVDYSIPSGPKTEGLMFVFFGGILDDQKIKSIKLQKGELSEYKFVSVEKAKILTQGTKYHISLPERLETAMEILKNKRFYYYLEDGKKIK